MHQSLMHMALLVREYDEAIAWFTTMLGFELREDTPQSPEKRWVRVAPKGSRESELLLARAATDDQRAYIGKQGGGRVFMFLRTDDFWRDFDAMTARGVTFVRPPSTESYGTVAVFSDLYGNLWDLVQMSPSSISV
jgi:catechol 2,3-dioxygenase-like lactoylglutathione lyase family enzyme